MIKTIIIDAKKTEREKIVSLLSCRDDITVLAQGEDAYDALRLAANLQPDIAVLDNQLDFIKSEKIPPLIKARSPGTGVVILSEQVNDERLYRALTNKVSGFVQKNADMEILPRILTSVSEGGCFISPCLAARVVRMLSEMPRTAAAPGLRESMIPAKTAKTQSIREDPLGYLSKMELRILTCIGEGLDSREIARCTKLSAGTVRNYISAIMRKSGLENRSLLARCAFLHGLVPINK